MPCPWQRKRTLLWTSLFALSTGVVSFSASANLYSALQERHYLHKSNSRSHTLLSATTTAPPSGYHLEAGEASGLLKLFEFHRKELFRNRNVKLKSHIDYPSYERRKDEWAKQYTSVEALRQRFGTNRNKVWGDLDAATTRRLYKTLLPKALLELYDVGVHPADLAPLAYRARVAAKLYARERSNVPARVVAHSIDGFRMWQRYGSFDTGGMTYQQVWNKYAQAVLDEMGADDTMDPEDVTAKICLKILERSCVTNERIDKLVLRNDSAEERQDLKYITEKLEQDVRHLLQPIKKSEKQLTSQRIKTLRRLVRVKRRLEGLQPNRLIEYKQAVEELQKPLRVSKSKKLV